MSDLVRSVPGGVEVDSAEQAQHDLVAARVRLLARLEALEGTAPALRRLRDLVRARPGLTLGGAFLVGWGLARLLRRGSRTKGRR